MLAREGLLTGAAKTGSLAASRFRHRGLEQPATPVDRACGDQCVWPVLFWVIVVEASVSDRGGECNASAGDIECQSERAARGHSRLASDVWRRFDTDCHRPATACPVLPGPATFNRRMAARRSVQTPTRRPRPGAERARDREARHPLEVRMVPMLGFRLTRPMGSQVLLMKWVMKTAVGQGQDGTGVAGRSDWLIHRPTCEGER